jgi:LAGLIDADG endonuclease
MKSIIEYLDCGKYVTLPGQDWGNFVVTKVQDINEKIIPFFDKYPLHGIKALDIADFV